MNNAYLLYDQFIKSNLLLADGDRRFFSQYDLTPARFYALKHIHERPGLSLSALSQLLLCTKGNATRILKGMEDQGHIRRCADPRDSRAYQLELTAEGQALFTEVWQAYLLFNKDRFAHFDSDSLENMLREMRALNGDFQKQLTE